MFPQLRIHVSAKHNGRVQAKLVEETSVRGPEMILGCNALLFVWCC